jgi:hypothetical protein
MADIQAHPWFRDGLPEGAQVMNTLILRNEGQAQLRQAPEEIRWMVKVGRVALLHCVAAGSGGQGRR